MPRPRRRHRCEPRGSAAALAWHAERIARNVDFAISQRNNHGISEGVGLFTVGVTLPELESAERWRALGRRVIEAEVHRQVFADGAYVQHSMTYHRVMLHDMAWALRLGDAGIAPLADDVRSHVARAADWLAQFVDPSSGQVPNHGANDGALVLPLSDAEFGDFRPVVQLARAIASGCRTYDPGPWDEPLAWLGIEGGALRSVPPQAAAPLSGTSCSTASRAARWFVARGTTRGRRTQTSSTSTSGFDGDNVACDAGTYLYTAEPPWDNALARTAVHNTVTVDGRDQMTRVGRFLWAHWAQGRVAEFDAGPRARVLRR